MRSQGVLKLVLKLLGQNQNKVHFYVTGLGVFFQNWYFKQPYLTPPIKNTDDHAAE